MAKKTARNTGVKLAKRRNPNIAEAGKATQFKKGYDPRRNLKGRPKSFDQFRALAQDMAEQIATGKDGKPLTWNGQEVTFAEHILLTWLTDSKYLEKFMEVAFGKVPQAIEHTGAAGAPLFPPERLKDLDDKQLAALEKAARILESAGADQDPPVPG